jgi:hypothetical protein
MNIGNIATNIIIFIVIFAISYYLINLTWPTTRSIATLGSSGKAQSLSKDAVIQDTSIVASNFLGGASGTIIFYLFIQSIPRTSDIDVPYKRILGIPGSFELQIATDGSARLSVTTQSAVNRVENVDLQPIPKQKWVQVAILREGRRFDIMYNDTIVKSVRMQQLPAIRLNSVYAGQDGLLGIVGPIRSSPRRYTPQEVIYEHKYTSDTRGNPNIKISLDPPSICPAGQTCPSNTKAPESTLHFLGTPYS